jgi:hypothetical protein
MASVGPIGIAHELNTALAGSSIAGTIAVFPCSHTALGPYLNFHLCQGEACRGGTVALPRGKDQIIRARILGLTWSGEVEREAPAQTELRPTSELRPTPAPRSDGASPACRAPGSRLSSALRFFLRFSRRNPVSLFRKRWVLSRDSVGWPKRNEIRD